MATIGEYAGTSNGCGAGLANTGELGCDIEFGLVIHAIGLTSGTIIPKDTTFDLDYINGLIQDGKAIPLMNAFSSEPTFSEDTLETSPLGVEALALKGLPKFMLTMKKGQYYYKQMAQLFDYGNFEWILGDVNGNWKLATTSNGDFKGFTTGQTLPMMTTPATASETEKKSITFQLIDRNEYDSNYNVLLSSVFFPITDVKGVNGVNLSFADANGAVPPAATDTTLKVKAVFASDNNTLIAGLTIDDFGVAVNLTPVTPSSVVEDSDGYYTITLPSPLVASEDVEVAIYDVANSKQVVITTGQILLRSDYLLQAVVTV